MGVCVLRRDIDDTIMLSTSPMLPQHWGHTFLSFPRALQCFRAHARREIAFSTAVA